MRRLLRRLGWDRNPLRRWSDRVEAWLNAVLLLVLLIAGGILSVTTARSAYRGQAAAAAWDRAHRFEVWAVLVERPVQGTAKARWKAPGGAPRTGPVIAGESTAAGTWLPIWVDEKGSVVAEPPRRRPATRAAEIAVVSLLLVAAVLALIRLLVVRLLDRQRMRAWETAWQTETGRA